MHSLWHWLLHLLCWASADPAVLEHERARCAGSVAVAYAAMAPEPSPHREEAPPPLPLPPRPPAAPCVECGGTGRIYRSDGGWVKCRCKTCPDGCPPKKVLP